MSLGNRFDRPARACGCLDAICQTTVNHEWYLRFSTQSQVHISEEPQKLSTPPEGNLAPRQEQRWVAYAEEKQGGKIEPHDVSAHGQTPPVVGGPAHPGTLETPRRACKRRCRGKLSGQLPPSADGCYKKTNETPEGDEKRNESERMSVEVVLHSMASCRKSKAR